ncbi:MAG: UDP-N-acetylglucosamine 1-carboxyvinyltransferase [Defluviitaleaceae bacterium]|nr:UDP-N-acetylglucosamine 1-carboxyvinyltransferase [Defluviitaleaceae bacterium]
MGEYRIKGGKRLKGEVRIGGSKNAVLPIFAATVLNGSESILHNCPLIQDTFISIEILKHIGCTVTIEKSNHGDKFGNTIIVDSSKAHNWNVPEKFTNMMRSSVLFMGSLLGRFGKADISFPGGCKLGNRPIDMHVKSLKKMGAAIKTGDMLCCRTMQMQGTQIHLDFPSVGATENIMLAAALSIGETVILNAAREPEIVDLEHFLNGMGAKIKGAGTSTIVINGAEKLHSVEHSVMPDRIVAGTYLTAVAITGGEVSLVDIWPRDIVPVTAKLAEMGCQISETGNTITLKAPPRLQYVSKLETSPHPGFPTDLQAPFVTALSVADGTSVVAENIFSCRFGHVPELQRMGADIMVMQDGRNFVVRGVEQLKGASVEATDLRCGAALILAGLVAEGETTVTNSHHVERGYQQIELDLQAIGANISYH